MRHLLFAALLAFTTISCDKTKPTGEVAPVRVPVDASLVVRASSLSELLSTAEVLTPISVADRGDGDKPAWFFCQADLCALHRAAGAEETKRIDDRWVVPDEGGSLVVWGTEDRAALDEAIVRWRAGGVPAKAPPARGLAGRVDPSPVLQMWKPRSERSKQLLQRVMHQSGVIRFELARSDTATDITLRMETAAGEPRFVESLGSARAELPRVSGFVDSGLIGAVRLSGDPERIWELIRSTLAAEQRVALDGMLEQLKTEAALDPVSAVLENTQGHLFVAAYGLSEEPAESPADWIALRATHEAVLVPIRQAAPFRKLLDAWTQLSHGKLHVQKAKGERLEWAWIDDGELRWTVVLADDYLVFVDSSVALDHFRQWITRPAPIDEALRRRGLDDLLEGTTRSGAYVDVAALRALFGDSFPEFLKGIQSARVVALTDAGDEVVQIRLLARP